MQMTLLEAISTLLIVAGLFFFFAGSVGMVRFPDVYTRLHSVTKADNLGLGLVVSGLVITASDWTQAIQLLLVWALVMLASTNAAYLISGMAREQGIEPWEESP